MQPVDCQACEYLFNVLIGSHLLIFTYVVETSLNIASKLKKKEIIHAMVAPKLLKKQILD